MKNGTRTQSVKAAFRKGYRVLPDGRVESPHGRIRKCHLSGGNSKPRYYRFTVKVPGNTAVPVMVHQLVAMQKFGEAAYMEAACVRHLDGDPTNNAIENIALGSHRDNAMDRPTGDRREHAKKAGMSRSKIDWMAVDADREKGMGYRKLAKKYGISRGTLAYHYGKGKYAGKLMKG